MRPVSASVATFGVAAHRRFHYILTGGFGRRWPGKNPESGLREIRRVHDSNAGTVLPSYGLNSITRIAGGRPD